MQAPPRFRRILLKLSGEALTRSGTFGIDPEILRNLSEEIAAINAMGVEIALVVGGGNIFRGINAPEGMDRVAADHMGMLATLMNSLALQDSLENVGVTTRRSAP